MNEFSIKRLIREISEIRGQITFLNCTHQFKTNFKFQIYESNFSPV